MITRVSLSNLANPLFCVTGFFLSVIYFLFPFLVLCFRFEFCVSVLSFVFLFWKGLNITCAQTKLNSGLSSARRLG